MYGFLRRPKWVLGHVLVVTVVVTFTILGFWQLDRLDHARARNAAVAAQVAAPPQPLSAALADSLEPYTKVVAEGTYAADAQVLTAPRSRDGRPGHHVLTPLETDAGAVLVDRGWVPFDRDGIGSEEVAPPEGAVQVEGLLMPPEEGDAGAGEFVGVIDPEVVEARTGISLVPAYLHLDGETSGAGLLPSTVPSPDEGNHLSYAVQWFLFTGVVLIGYPILIARTARDTGRAPPPDVSPQPRDMAVPASRTGTSASSRAPKG